MDRKTQAIQRLPFVHCIARGCRRKAVGSHAVCQKHLTQEVLTLCAVAVMSIGGMILLALQMFQ